MKNILKYTTILVLTVVFSSCLKKGLDDFPEWTLNNISNIYVEYRYNGATQYNGQAVVEYKRLTVTQTIDNSAKTIAIAITVPAASGTFTTAIRNAVTQSNIIPYFDIATAATMQGTEGTPNPGTVTDFTKPLRYKVTAADGSSSVWTVTTTSFTK